MAGGIVLGALVQALAAQLPETPWIGALAALGPPWAIALGILVSAGSVLISGHRLSEETMRELDLIERIIERGELTDIDRRQAWRNVAQKAVDAFDPQSERRLSPEKLAQRSLDEARRN